MIRLGGISKVKIISLFTVFVLLLSGCGTSIASPYASSVISSEVAGRGYTAELKADSFAKDICVVTEDIPVPGLQMANNIEAVLLVDVTNAVPMAAVNAHRLIHPASTTKLMTALLALENCTMDEKLVLGEEVTGFRYDAQVLPGKVGDTMTMDQALHFMLMYSANDISNAIGVHIAGSLSAFNDMMNEKARELGATNTHFCNAHGLDEDEHLTTAYDLYLILSACIKYDKFIEIVSSPEYSTVYYDAQGNEVERTVRSTDLFIRTDKDVNPPSGITVIGGKTGTTGGAGHCLIVLCRDTAGKPYISCVMGTPDSDTLYAHQKTVMSLILEK